MLLLSSYERTYRYACLEDNATNKRVVNQFLWSTSAQIQAYINNDLELKSRVEYHDIHSRETEFFVKSHPVTLITSVKHDFEGLFVGNQQTLTNMHIGARSRSLVLDYPELPGKRALELTYTGGYSTSATLSTYAIGTVVGAFIVGKFVRGALSGAVGIIKAFTPTSMQVEVLYGVFSTGETLNMQTTEGGNDVASISAVLTSKTIECIAELLPEVTMACEVQIRYNIKTKDDFELRSTMKDMITRRANQEALTFRGAYQDLQPEVRSMLNKHRRYMFQ